MQFDNVIILALWLLIGWLLVWKIKWCDQLASIIIIEVTGPAWMAYLLTFCVIVFWPIGPVFTILLMRWYCQIKGINIDKPKE